MKICIHEPCNDVDGIQGRLGGAGGQNVVKTENVLVLEMAQQLDLSQSSLRVFQILKGICYLLYSDRLASFQIYGRTSENKLCQR